MRSALCIVLVIGVGAMPAFGALTPGPSPASGRGVGQVSQAAPAATAPDWPIAPLRRRLAEGGRG